jgi:F-type H+-transporting ATPase subunit epsilon
VKPLTVALVAPSQPLAIFRARSLTVPGGTGYFGILPGREPLITTLGLGLIHIVEEGGKDHWFAVTGGFFELIEDMATVLADALIPGETVEHPAHLRGKPLYIPQEFASEVQKVDLARAMLWRKLHPEPANQS